MVLIVGVNPGAAQRDQMMDMQKEIQGYRMEVTWRRMKMNMVKPFAEAVEEITMLMSSGFAVTSVRGGSMGNV